jgi:hypothetical protein
MSLTDAMKEAYAEPDLEDVIIDTLELDHPAFEQPIRIVPNADADMTLGGHLHQALGMSITLSGFDDDGQTTGQIRIENVSSMLVPYLYAAVQAGTPIEVTYRAYLQSNLNTPGEVRGGLFLSKVSLNATSATGTLEAQSKHDTQAFPRLTYSLSKYKALHGG